MKTCIAAWTCLAGVVATADAQVLEGRRAWDVDVPVSVAPGIQGTSPGGTSGIVSLPDGSGGAFIVWVDVTGAALRAQRLDRDGLPRWGGGIVVSERPGYKFRPAAIPDGAGGLVVAWIGGEPPSFCVPSFLDCDVYAQRLNPNGVPQWGSQGAVVTVSPGAQGSSGLALATDATGGAYLAWEESNPVCCTYAAQHLDATGVRTWSPAGERLGALPTVVLGPVSAEPRAVPDGSGGVIFAWIDQQRPPAFAQREVRVQRFTSTFVSPWPGAISLGSHGRVSIDAMLPDGHGGAVLAWLSMADATDPDDGIAFHRVAADGSLPWGGPRVVATSRGRKEEPAVTSDGAGGWVAVWADSRQDVFGNCGALIANCDIYAQRVSDAGIGLWGPGGVAVETAVGSQLLPAVVADGTGGAIVSWQDCRDWPTLIDCLANLDMYAQHLAADGTRVWPAGAAKLSDAPYNQGGFGPGTPAYRVTTLVSDGAGGAIATWPDGRAEPCEPLLPICDVYAQRVVDAPARHPWNLTALTDANSVRFDWTAPAAGPVAGYLLEVGTVPGASDLAVLPLGPATSFAAVGPAGLFHARVRGRLPTGGTSAATNDVAFRLGCQGPPSAPTGLSAVLNGAQVILAWTMPPGIAATALLEAGRSTALADIATIPVQGAGFSVTAPVGHYVVRVRASNSCGTSEPSGETFFDVGSASALPGAPGTPSASVAGRVVTLSWTAPASGQVIGYVLEAGTSPGRTDLVTVPLPAAAAFSASVPPGRYFVRVRAVTPAGSGPPSLDREVVVP
jgi:hypothetical protein